MEMAVNGNDQLTTIMDKVTQNYYMYLLLNFHFALLAYCFALCFISFIEIMFSVPFQFLLQLEANDKEIKLKAIDDLRSELGKLDCDVSEAMQKKLMAAVIDLFKVKAKEVRELSLTCIVPLFKKLSPNSAERFFDSLMHLLSSSDPEQRKISHTAIRKLYTEVPFDELPESERDVSSVDVLLAAVDELYEKYSKIIDMEQQGMTNINEMCEKYIKEKNEEKERKKKCTEIESVI